MALWVIFTVLTVVVLVWVMHPVIWPSKDLVEEQAFERAVYRDQLQELERDAERGIINEKEKESALNEVSRRLLGVQASKGSLENLPSSTTATSVVAVISVVAITGFTGLVYNKLGNPKMPDQPQDVRIENAAKNGDMAAMIVQVQRYLRKNPTDLKGWRVLAPALRRAERFNEAGEAYAKIMQLDKPTAPVLVDYAESLLLGNQGLPNEKVRKALKAALELDKTHAKGRFYWAMALQQDGFPQKALKEWRTLLDQNPKNLELQMAVQRQIASLKDQVKGNEAAKIPALDKDQRDAAAGMSPKERQAMIASMVERLATRLKEDGSDLGGWQRLIRARMVLGQKDAAVAALKTAKDNFKNNEQALARLAQLSSELGL
ncbi:Cytochrome c heme lyase subunit CcmH [hydrothermal vent metagenome]|uniref:Cytochrome c heme lyase subunit CcmH n=1 Tax=hydrothermal vent metagenome TaxID=652676 RepID=A0A3B0SNX8_9ZZZZ